MEYEFKEEDAFRFAKERGIQCRRNGNELTFNRCPYCHGNHKDKDTFSINLSTGLFHCLRASCGVSGNMITLAKDFDFSLGRDIDVYYQIRPTTFRKFKKPDKPIQPKDNIIEYFKKRSIPKEVLEKYEITSLKDKNIIVFPFFDEDGKIQFIKYRKTDFRKEVDKNKEWCEKNCKPILFGMKQCNLDNNTLIITEGQIDSLSVATAGFDNALSVPNGARGFTWIPHCWDWITQNFKTIIVFGDLENGQMSLLEEISHRFKSMLIKYVIAENYQGCKDANEILCKYGKQQIVKCIKEAQDIPLENIKDLSDIREPDIFSWEKLKTGLPSLDRRLYGGIPFAGVTIITSQAGMGKSTFVSQLILMAREQGYKSFIYTGELAPGIFKAWLTIQAAGTRNFEAEYTGSKEKRYIISSTNKKIISDWYRDYIYIYSQSVLADLNSEEESLIDVIEKSINKLGIRVILVDNLMTALDMDNSKGDTFERQSKFVKKLTRLAVTYNVLVLLVAHKRKATGFGDIENDSIAGSSNIVNLGQTILSYDRVPKDEGGADCPDRILKITKERLFGHTYTKGWLLHFNERSKYIYEDGCSDIKDYSCFPKDDVATQTTSFREITEDDDNPFN